MPARFVTVDRQTPMFLPCDLRDGLPPSISSISSWTPWSDCRCTISRQCLRHRQRAVSAGDDAGPAHLLLRHRPVRAPLESNWRSGKSRRGDTDRGIRARDGFVVDLAWDKGKLTSAVIHSTLGEPCKVRYGDKVVAVNIKKGGSVVLGKDLTVVK